MEIKDLLIALIPSLSSVAAIIITVIGCLVKIKHIRSDDKVEAACLKKKLTSVIEYNNQIVQEIVKCSDVIKTLQEENHEYKEFLKDTVVDLNELIVKFEDDINIMHNIEKEMTIARKDIKQVLNNVNKN